MLTLVILLKGMVEVIAMFFLGQWVLALLSGAQRQHNPVYRLFALCTQPVLRLIRCLTPRIILDQHLPWLAGFWLVLSWLGLTAAKIYLIMGAV